MGDTLHGWSEGAEEADDGGRSSEAGPAARTRKGGGSAPPPILGGGVELQGEERGQQWEKKQANPGSSWRASSSGSAARPWHLLPWTMDTWYVALLSFVGDDVAVHTLHNSA